MNGNEVSIRVLGISTKRNFENPLRDLAARANQRTWAGGVLEGVYVVKLHKCVQKRFLTLSTEKIISPICVGGFG